MKHQFSTMNSASSNCATCAAGTFTCTEILMDTVILAVSIIILLPLLLAVIV